MKKMNGVTVVEFAMTSTFLMLVLLAVVSIGHFMYSMQAVNEAVRAAARMAAVCQVGDVAVKNYVASYSYISSIGSDNIEIEYLDGSSNVLVGPSPEDVRFVRARAVNLDYQFVALLTFLGENGLMALPSFETTIPSESLGLVPNDTDTNC
ncbi:pilus assembly protein [Vibrio sp. SCSIO 43135]|uniref:Pilus assembly protein n=1 Tax=Vibrio paucivorans TaxID=2829489 RepID=A0A9X3HRT2_9VIBR|nr:MULTISPECIES: TadE family protein [Vibrio]MCW8334179.1 pilus assembly protein [Vibrio paucivorans]USD42874.1 pilus assembly protein [Vibrio sp. SCSIO 43135]